MSLSHPTILLAALVSIILFSRWCRRYTDNPKGLALPPSPPARFLVGNLKDLPSGGREWEKYYSLSKKYGSDIIYLNVLGTSVLSVNSFEAANELLNQRSAVWSDRPRLVMIKELMGWDWNLVLQSYSEGWADHRRIVQQQFQPQVVAKYYRRVMVREVKVLLQNLHSTPHNFVHHLKRMAGAIIMMVTYGHEVRTDDDPFIKLAEEVRRHSEETPGAALVDTLPILKYLPTWLAPFKRTAFARRNLAMQMRDDPYRMVKTNMAAGTAVPCMVASLLEEKFRSPGRAEDELIRNCGGVVYSAGTDTTAAALNNFFLALVLYPDAQKRTQDELDAVVGRERLPDFTDQEKLPSIGRLVKETLRWRAVTPLGVPHCTTQAEEYRNFYIPARTTVLANISAMLHDDQVYENPDKFNPDRFLPHGDSQSEPDPTRAAFGFGRRVCPGRFFAEDSIWIAMAQILHVFNIGPSDGDNTTKPEIEWSSGLVSLPSAFSCDIQMRFKGAETLISTVDE